MSRQTSPADAKIFLRYHEQKLEIPEEELDKLHVKGRSVTNGGTIFVVRSRKKLKLNEVVRDHRLIKKIEAQMKIMQAEDRIKTSREPLNAEDIAKAYRSNGPKVRPINVAKEIEALLSKLNRSGVQ